MKPGQFSYFEIMCPSSPHRWKIMTEARMQMIKPHLDSFTLQRLGDVECPAIDGTGLSSEVLRNHIKVVSDSQLNLQGIYGLCDYENLRIGETGKMQLWGLTRKAIWVSGTLTVSKRPAKEIKNFDAHIWGLTINEFQLNRVELDELILFWKLSIWQRLGDEIQNWYRQSARRYRTARKLAETVRIDRQLLTSAK